MAKLTLFFHNRIVLHYPLTGKVACIGRDKNCEICIDSLAVAERHAWVTPQGSDYALSATSEDTLLLVNHQPVQNRLLQHGDRIQIGKHTLSFAESVVTPNFLGEDADAATVCEPPTPSHSAESSESPQLENKGCIQVVSGEHLGKIISLYPPLVRLGLTGRQFAMVSRRREGYYLSHLAGQKTPQVDGRAIGNESILLQDGAMIEIDGIEMRFYADTAALAAETQPANRNSAGSEL